MQTLDSLIRASGQPSLLEGRSGGAFTVTNSGVFQDSVIELGTKTSSGKHVTEQTALTISAVYRCVSLISGSLAMMPLRVQRINTDGSYEILPEHYLSSLLSESFNSNWTSFRAKRFIVEQVLLRGNAYCKYEVSANGRVISLTPLHADRVTAIPQSNGSLRYLVIEADGVTREYTANSILHFRNLESNDLGIGLSTIQAGRNTFGLSLASEEASARLFSNGLVTPGYLSLPGKLDAKARESFESSFAKQYSGSRNAFKIPLLEGGMTFQRTGLSPTDVQFLETRKLSLQEVGLLFGVPAHALGLGASTTATAEQEAISFLVYGLQPLMTNIEAEIENTLLSSAERKALKVGFDPDCLLRTDSKTRYEKYAKAITSGVMKPSEARAKENLPHDEAGDDLIVNAANLKLKDAGIQWTGAAGRTDVPVADDSDQAPEEESTDE